MKKNHEESYTEEESQLITVVEKALEGQQGLGPITPENAPRIKSELMKIGIFQLRLLAEKLGGFRTQEEKVVFAACKLEEKVSYVFILLEKWDKENGR